jgi:hypothetical protein
MTMTGHLRSIENRHERRSGLARFRRAASRSLLTYLVEPTDCRLDGAPLLQRAANHWLDALAARARHCIVCGSRIVDRQHVGALLLSTPDIANPTSVGTVAICAGCWAADLPADKLERACATALHEVIPHGAFEARR